MDEFVLREGGGRISTALLPQKKPLEHQQNTEKSERLADSREGEFHQG